MKRSTHEPESFAGATGSKAAPELVERFERLRALGSAWRVLAVSALSSGAHPVAEIGRVLNDHLRELAAQGPAGCDAAALAAADAGLDEFARMMRTVAFQVPISDLRALLPGHLHTDRRGVLDLLDVLIDFENAVDEVSSHVSAIDYVITLLCTGSDANGAAGLRHDPVMLTPRLHALSERAAAAVAPEHLAELEAEFIAASNMDAEDLYSEMRERKLRRRKEQLGESFFAPAVLRAIVNYNVRALERVNEEVSAAQEWGGLPPAAGEAEAAAGGSVFASEPLRQLASAVRRRAAGGTPERSALDRVAWCLDIDSPAADESVALLAEDVGQASNPRGTAVLVGLLNRSLIVLSDELPGIGVSPDDVSGPWVRELERALKAETHQLIASDAYQDACSVEALKNQLVADARGDAPRVAPPVRSASPVASTVSPDAEPAAAPAQPIDVLATARQLAKDAVAETERAPGASNWSVPGWARTLAAGVATIAIVGLGANVVSVATDSELDRFSGRQLEAVSPHLAKGHRNGGGAGTAFVGTLEDSWSALGNEERTEAALDLVASLRVQGVRDIMVYDRDGRLRLQLLGDQPLKLVP